MKIAVTGHRPDKLGGFSAEAALILEDFAIEQLVKYDVRLVLTGMALGWDQAVAQACRDLQIGYVACLPHENQEERWPEEAQKRYKELLSGAADVVLVEKGPYAALKMHKRNAYLVDNAEWVLALYSGMPGGTKHCYEMAVEEGKLLANCWQEWGLYVDACRKRACKT